MFFRVAAAIFPSGHRKVISPICESTFKPTSTAQRLKTGTRRNTILFFTRDGRQYALPKYHGALAPYYNKDLFDQAHVDYPSDYWTHDDYLAATKRITPDRNKDGKPNLQYDLYHIQASIAVTGPVHFVENDRTGVRVQRGIDELARWCNPPSSV
jgi:maltose-binding protein MalE